MVKEVVAYACFTKDTGKILEFMNGYGIFPKKRQAKQCAERDYRGAYKVVKVKIIPQE